MPNLPEEEGYSRKTRLLTNLSAEKKKKEGCRRTDLLYSFEEETCSPACGGISKSEEVSFPISSCAIVA